MKTIQIIFFVITSIWFLTSCEDTKNIDFGKYEVMQPTNPVVRGHRQFGINVSTSKYGFDASFSKAKEAGIQLIEINLPWSSIEKSEGNYINPDNVLTDISYYGNNSVQVGLCLSVINTVKWEIPDYLNGVDVASDKFVNAFNNMLDWVMEQIPDNVTISHISIGNEVDYVLEREEDWNNYTLFYSNVVKHIKSTYTGIKIGVKTTVLDGVFGEDKEYIQKLNRYSDVVMLNYYPQDKSFKVMSPEIAHQHFAELITLFPGEKIWMTELGYQSGHVYCASTETKQAHFYHNVFSAWDTHKDVIEVIIIDWLYDQSPEIIESWKDYYGSDPALVEYLSTLGLLHYDGIEKAAWQQILAESTARSW